MEILCQRWHKVIPPQQKLLSVQQAGKKWSEAESRTELALMREKGEKAGRPQYQSRAWRWVKIFARLPYKMGKDYFDFRVVSMLCMARQANFYRRVHDIVKKIPCGRVATYQQVAMMASTPRAAQAVGWALRALHKGHGVPWQRVINSRGMISIQNVRAPKALQVRLLREEGVEVREIDGNYFVDLEQHLWRPRRL